MYILVRDAKRRFAANAIAYITIRYKLGMGGVGEVVGGVFYSCSKNSVHTFEQRRPGPQTNEPHSVTPTKQTQTERRTDGGPTNRPDNFYSFRS